MRAAVLWAIVTAASAANVAAQDVGGYVTAGSGAIDYGVHREPIVQLTGGVLWRLAGDRIRIGGEVDAMTSNGYWAGRGGPLAELVLVRRARITPFIRGGRFVGEDSSWIAGAGVDFWVTGHGAIRMMVQDAFRHSPYTSRTYHEPAFQVGWSWK